jgi:hypothetical protein
MLASIDRGRWPGEIKKDEWGTGIVFLNVRCEEVKVEGGRDRW